MLTRKGQLPILIFNLAMLVFFTTYYIHQKNYEFMIYIGVVAFFLTVFLISIRKVYFPNALLWSLTIWALCHLSGGTFYIKGKLLYEIILIPLSSNYPIFRYDQFVHIIGFGTATMVIYYVLKPLLKAPFDHPVAISIIIISAGLGLGALNEIIEFAATVTVPETGVGGYINTSLDLVADFVGALLAAACVIISKKYKS